MAPPQKKQPPPPFGVLPLHRGTTTAPLRGATPLTRGGSFCPPDKGGSRGVFFPIGKQGGSPKKKQTPSPLRGTPPYQGDNNGPPSGGYPPDKGGSFCPPDKGGSRGVFFPTGKQGGSPKKKQPPPPFGVLPLIRGTTTAPFGGLPPDKGESFCPPDKGGSRGVYFPTGKQGGSPKKPPPQT